MIQRVEVTRLLYRIQSVGAKDSGRMVQSLTVPLASVAGSKSRNIEIHNNVEMLLSLQNTAC